MQDKFQTLLSSSSSSFLTPNGRFCQSRRNERSQHDNLIVRATQFSLWPSLGSTGMNSLKAFLRYYVRGNGADGKTNRKYNACRWH